MKFYLAPMEGLTGFVFRNAYQKHFGNIDTYFTPFINNKKMNYKEIKDILPEHNEGMHVVPQILTNRAEDFLAIAKELGNYGYESVNLNLGCPSGTPGLPRFFSANFSANSFTKDTSVFTDSPAETMSSFHTLSGA